MIIRSTQRSLSASIPEGNRRASKARDDQGEGPAARVSLSPDAAFVQALAAEASDAGVRPDVVAETRAALEDGTFEQSIDMDKVLDAILGEV